MGTLTQERLEGIDGRGLEADAETYGLLIKACAAHKDRSIAGLRSL